MSNEIALLKEISRKLSQLIFIIKLSNLKLIEETRKKIREDRILQAILDSADGSLSSSDLNQKVRTSTSVSKATVKRRIAWLSKRGALISTRKGNEMLYENSRLYD